VTLNVSSLEPMASFYEQAIGLERLGSAPGSEVLGAGGEPVVELVEAPQAPLRPAGSTGLFHLAILEPDRQALAAALRRLLEAGASLDGASDHLVSEALYLRDPEGNGIEIYRDRPESEWRWEGGEVAMATLPLDLAGLLSEPEQGAGRPGEAVLGHVHMNVADLPAAVAFYTGVLGLDLTSGSYPGAAFVSADGYHHHFGLNTWNGAGAPAPAPGALGLSSVTLIVPGQEAEAIAGRARAAGTPVGTDGGTLVVTDPDGVALRIKALPA